MEVLRTSRYERDLKRLKASAINVATFGQTIVDNPFSGDVVPGLGGIRKIRFSFGNKGKRGGGRAIYFLMVGEDLAVMLFAYAKSEKEDLTSEERKLALALMKEITDGQN